MTLYYYHHTHYHYHTLSLYSSASMSRTLTRCSILPHSQPATLSYSHSHYLLLSLSFFTSLLCPTHQRGTLSYHTLNLWHYTITVTLTITITSLYIRRLYVPHINEVIYLPSPSIYDTILLLHCLLLSHTLSTYSSSLCPAHWRGNLCSATNDLCSFTGE